ncbi:MAG: type II toxin-antitoxin system RelE/ParE family toxin [Limnochordia bacterium]|jgi:plasmid stabilization system protein ParE|nr:type II toxin-antitoxin system RelE/ParE family toxin [Limnochordia bacterium]
MSQQSKPYTVKITETAWEMLISHTRFFANVSTPAANRLIEAFVEVTDNLATMPERNPWLEHDSIPFRKYRRLLFRKHYMVLYQIRENVVYVTAVVDCRGDYCWLL